MKLFKCREILNSKRLRNIIVFLFLLFVVSSFASEWKAATRIQSYQAENEQRYQGIVTNVVLLNRCYVETPDENYCFTVLKIIGSQLNQATFNTENLKIIWLNCYMYLASVKLAPYPKLHDRIVSIAVNEATVGGSVDDYAPADKQKIEAFHQELRATYRARIQLETNKRLNKNNASTATKL